MWDLIVSVPDHCLSIYFAYACYLNGFIFDIWPKRRISILLEWNSDNRGTYIYVSTGLDK